MANRYIDNEEVRKLVQQAEEIKTNGTVFSDIIDSEGYQYVDLVQEGGGVLGIALVGYTYILEKAGIRFYSLAGTSAGSINTLLMAAVGKPGEATSERILELIGDKDFFDFVDGPSGIKKLIQKKIDHKGSICWPLIKNIRRIYLLLINKLGINPGDHFESWLTQGLEKYNINTVGELKDRRNQIPQLIHRQKPDFKFDAPDMAIITSEITTHTKVDFPRMAELYWSNVDALPPAKFVRASMSIPFFFVPFKVDNIPNAGKKEDENWDKYASYGGEIPQTIKFVDGGMLSNFPINIFHIKSGTPSRPTFGVRLSTYRKKFSPADKIFGFSGAMINTMRQIHDYDFLLKNPDYKELICRIDADEEFNWLNFGMSEKQQQDLFLLGAKKGLEFLQKFKWEEYKKIRENC